MDEKWIGYLQKATREVFDTMIFIGVEPDTPLHGLATETAAHVVASVPFAGESSGLVAFHTAIETAKQLAGSMLGMAPAEVDGEMTDAMGEIANMIAGGFRLALKSSGIDLAISVPTVITGSDFRTRYVTPVTRVLCPFRLENGGTVYVELIVNQ